MNRRGFLSLGAAAAGWAFAADRAVGQVRVTNLEIFRVPVNKRGQWLLVRLSTSAGISGIGEASHGGVDLESVGLLRQLFEGLKGRSVSDIEWLRQQAKPEVERRGRVAAVALSGLEQCLWDIQGKLYGAPVYQLFGGKLRDRIRNYANINRSTEVRTPSAFAGLAEKAVAAGFDAVKLAPFDGMPRESAGRDKIEAFTNQGIECIAAVRKAIGPKCDLLVDAHSHFDLTRGLELARRLEPMNLYWLEEVTPLKPVEDLAAINRTAKMTTAGGETLYGVAQFYPYILAGAVDILMPDIKYCGGLLELKKIAAIGEAAGLPVAPHGPASPVGNVAAAHVCAGLPNFNILEFAFGEVPWRADIVDPPELLANGYSSLSERPGFGIQLNDRFVVRHRVG